MEIRRTVSMFDLKTTCEEMHVKCQGTQSALSMLRPNILRFLLTPLTANERCRLVQNQLEQLQNEHSQLLSHTGRQTESNNDPPENEVERASESTQVCIPGPVGMDREERPGTGYELKIIQSDIEAAEKQHKEMESDLENLLRDKSDLEREVASVKSKLEIENLQLKAEQHIHSRITFQIKSRRELEKSSAETRRELRENVAEVKNLVKRVQDENAIFAGYIMRKKAKLSIFQRLRRWLNNLNCFRSHAPDEEQENTSIY